MKISVFGFTTTRRFASIAIIASFVFTNALALGTVRGDGKTVTTTAREGANYTTDLTQLGREGRLRENLNFENETMRLIKVLGEGGKRQPVIVDEDRAVFEIIVEQAALRIAKGNAPANLAERSIVKMETAVLFSRATNKAEAAAAIDAIVEKVVSSNGRVILFVDDMVHLVGSRAATTKLFDAVAEGKLVMIGGSSAAAYDDEIESKPEIAAFF